MLNTRAQCLRYATRQLQATCEKRSQYSRGFGRRYISTNSSRASQRHFTSPFYLLVAAGLGAGTVHLVSGPLSFPSAHAEAAEKDEEPVLEFEKPRRKGQTKEETRDLLSSQHVQVKKSLENPGVYAWGSNSGHVTAPDSDEKFIKTPRRLSFFDGMLLRDLKLDRTFGAAIDENGDLLQWGQGFSEHHDPIKTLRGKNLKSLAISRDRIVALGTNGAVYSIPISAKLQTPTEPGWFSWRRTPSIAYRQLTPPNLGWTEKFTAIASGLDHLLLLTSSGRVFSAPTSPTTFPSRGQLGLSGPLSRISHPDSTSHCHELTTLRGFPIAQIAAGDYHSLVRDRDGRVFSFGDNSLGQLGLDLPSTTASYIDVPSLIPIHRLYTNSTPKVTAIAAGGSNSYFAVDATPTAPSPTGHRDTAGGVIADTWSCGSGIYGTLGNGRWTHLQSAPTKIPALSGLYEWSEAANQIVPIRVGRVSVGSTHVATVMGNETSMRAGEAKWGADVLFFGGNEFYQLGTGKRNNVAAPVYIGSLEGEGEEGEENRLQLTPRARVRVGGRWVDVEQRVECGRGVTAVYSGV
ncbi:RCC1/BLIP-II [Eremomyces bilateralis CBS 781.70]|uniref:RCC1/BLIP-II n=1 Tax=Eremomyces bilateralis CBS 781.70 TaxID=1392243 RepID=A0A6G1G056_9PEZI|nr:RCC1/BLIP-II [Eremomyces bilateralis CBS 781.70]KAF1811311.1 RCC1/BLIP-II [Eremomyces bilateralis CBS 781.70]